MSTPLHNESGFEAFRRFVLVGTALQEELAGLTDHEAFAGRAVELGKQHGFQFQPADVEAAIQAARRAWTDSMSV
jgi:hypothetical protein